MASKVAVVSGGTDGIGKAIVLQLLKEGFQVATFSRSKTKCDDLSWLLAKGFSDDDFLVLPVDVTKEELLSPLIDQTIKKFGRIDVLVNNAGMGYFVDSDQVSIPRYREMIEVNLVGLAALTKLVVPHMKKNRSGLIINIASMSGKRALPRGEFYSATKFGLMGYSEGLRNELREHGIKVSTVSPGMVKTQFFTDEELERRKEMWNSSTPPMLEAENVAKTIAFICNQPPQVDIRDVLIMPF